MTFNWNNFKEKICIVGLGYVGLPLALEFGKYQKVYGFDINEKRIESLKKGVDYNGEHTKEEILNKNIEFSSDPKIISQSNFLIIAVPTPIDKHKKPDITALKSASELVGKHMKKGSVVVYESTVYPGLTEEICIPILEKTSNMKSGTDFKVGYSPERINPGDKEHTIDKIIKVVSGQDKETLKIVARVYSKIIKVGVYEAPSIKVAEAAKVIENTQRDINIALMNELKQIFDKMNIDTNEVLKAAKTKWNFLDFYPGLVGGHCIGVDPYYLAYKAEEVGHHPEIILAGRRINDGMVDYTVNKILKRLIEKDCNIKKCKVLVLGITFKPNVKDTRNSKAIEVVKKLQEFVEVVDVFDPLVDKVEGLKLIKNPEFENYDLVVTLVNHDVLVNSKIKASSIL